MKTTTYIYKGVVLEAPQSYIDATEDQRQAVCNGIGPQWAAISGFVNTLMMMLNNILGLDCKVVGDIHDWMYHYSDMNNREKSEADIVLLMNGKRWIWAKTSCILLAKLRVAWMTRYYITVSEWGYKAFYDRHA